MVILFSFFLGYVGISFRKYLKVYSLISFFALQLLPFLCKQMAILLLCALILPIPGLSILDLIYILSKVGERFLNELVFSHHYTLTTFCVRLIFSICEIFIIAMCYQLGRFVGKKTGNIHLI